MSRLYDRILRYPIQKLGAVRDPKIATVVVIDNAAEYYYKSRQAGDKIDTSIPGMIPALDAMFLETRGSVMGNMGQNMYAYGLLLYTSKIDDENPLYDGYKGWDLALNYIAESRKNEMPWSVFAARAFLTKDGQFTWRKKGGLWGNGRPIEFDKTLIDDVFIRPISQYEYLENMLAPFKFALALMNCKNVELIDNPPPPALSKAHEKKTGQPLVNYKTIKVNPMRTAKHVTDLTAEQPAPRSHLDLPLSIWRGHFKDYRDGRGLFGNPNMRGVYWWDQHVRGSIENGVNIKDYEVQAPHEKD